MGQYLGIVALGAQLKGSVVTRDGSNTPVDGTGNVTYRVYGPGGLMTNGTGNLAFKDQGSIASATNASPIVVTSNGHKLTTGTRLTLSGVGGNTAANGTFQVTVIDANTFSLDGSTGNGAYTSGGTWHVAGLYDLTLNAVSGDGYASGQNYSILVTAVVSGVVKADLYTFTCV